MEHSWQRGLEQPEGRPYGNPDMAQPGLWKHQVMDPIAVATQAHVFIRGGGERAMSDQFDLVILGSGSTAFARLRFP